MKDPVRNVIIFEPASQLKETGTFYHEPEPEEESAQVEDEPELSVRELLENLAGEFLQAYLDLEEYSLEDLGVTAADIEDITDEFIGILEDMGYTFEPEE